MSIFLFKIFILPLRFPPLQLCCHTTHPLSSATPLTTGTSIQIHCDQKTSFGNDPVTTCCTLVFATFPVGFIRLLLEPHYKYLAMRKWCITNFTYINKEHLKIVVAEASDSTQTRSLLSTKKHVFSSVMISVDNTYCSIVTFTLVSENS
jgi:hypothetical protein